MGAFLISMKAKFSAALTGVMFVLATSAMTGCATAESRWFSSDSRAETAAERARAARAERAAAQRRANARRDQTVRRARVIRTAPIVAEDKCRPNLAVVGDQYASESGAQGEADKAWMQTARWQWGERYMAREHADDATYECGRSSVGSVVGQVFYRCRLTAKPCRPDASPGK